MDTLEQAIVEWDVAKWKAAWEQQERLKAERERFRRYQELVNRLEAACPGIKNLLNSNRANSEWKHRLSNLDQAWA
jgi:hypothetical protein